MGRRVQVSLVEQRTDGQWFVRMHPVYPDSEYPAILMPVGGFWHGMGSTIVEAMWDAWRSGNRR